MLKYPISTLLYLTKLSIKDKIQEALKLHNNIDIRLTVTVKDKDGKIIKVHKQKSHSFVANFLAGIANCWVRSSGNSGTSTFPMVIVNNSSDYTVSGGAINAPAGNSTYGIVIGTGTATPKPSDYELGNQINNGTGTGEITYNAHQFNPSSGALPISGNTTSFQILRTFQNQSGASITVTEVGIIAQIWDMNATTQYALFVHDLLSSPITVPNNAVLTIVYTISIST